VQQQQQQQPSAEAPGGLPRWLFHQVEGSVKDGLLRDTSIRSRLDEQLEQGVQQFQDEALAEDEKGRFQLLPKPTADKPQADQEPVLLWRENVELVPVTATGPGRRAFNQEAGQHLQAVAPLKDFKAGELIGFYPGRLTASS
jgi:hypothetical protein